MATFRTSVAGGDTLNTTNRTVTITPAVGDLLVCFASLSGNSGWSPTMTDNNPSTTGWSLVGVCRWSSSANLMACWVRRALMANTTATTITAVTGSNTAGQLVVVAYSGMPRAGLNAIRQWGGQENQAASGTPTPAFPAAALTGNPTLWAVASGDTTTSPNASWTERQDVSQSTPTTALCVATRDSGFTGTSVAAAATQSTVYASMIVELDTDSSTFGISQSIGAQRLISLPTSGTQTTPSIDSAASGSTFVVGMARGNWATASPSAPTDNKGNTYTIIDTDHGYAGFPDSRQAVYRAEAAVGGSGHTFSANFGSFDVPPTTGDEITIFAIELTGNAILDASSHVSRTGAASLTTGNVTTTGAGLLVAVLWGTNGVGVTHFFHETPSQGWSKMVETCFEGDPGGGYIQVCVFCKRVFAAGTYSGTFFTENTEGAEIDLIALKVDTNVPRNPTESVAKPTDAVSRTTVLARNISESKAAPTDAVARVASFVRSIGETITKPTDSVARLFVGTRVPLESIAAPTDAPTRQAVQARNIGESKAAPTDAVARAHGTSRGIPESVASPTDAVNRTTTLARSIGESKAAPTDVVARAVSVVRAPAESITKPTDAAARSQTATRTVVEATIAPTDAVSYQTTGNQARNIGETIAKPADAVARAYGASRVIPESVTKPTDALARSPGLNRNVPESIPAPTDAVTRSLVLSRLIAEAVTAPLDAVVGIVFSPTSLITPISIEVASVMLRAIVANITSIIDVVPQISTAKLAVASQTLYVNVGGPMRSEQMFLGETKPIYITHTRDGAAHTLAGSVINVSVARTVDGPPIVSKSTTSGTVTISGDATYATSAIAAGDTVTRGEYVLIVEILWMSGPAVSERYVQVTNLSIR